MGGSNNKPEGAEGPKMERDDVRRRLRGQGENDQVPTIHVGSDQGPTIHMGTGNDRHLST